MSNNWIFKETSYKQTLEKLIESAAQPRGLISRLAEHIGCHRSYLSQVMGTKVHLTKDQAWEATVFFELTALQQAYFMNLVESERSSSPSYRKHIQSELRKIAREFQDLSKKYEDGKTSSKEEAAFYYMNWLPSAIHVLTTIKGYQSVGALSQRLNLPAASVRKILRGLEAQGLVKNEGRQWEFSGGTKFISKHSPYAVFHHQNWRHQAMLDAAAVSESGFHFTAAQSVSKKDVEALRSLIFEFIEKIDKIATPSEPENLIALCLDFFEPNL